MHRYPLHEEAAGDTCTVSATTELVAASTVMVIAWNSFDPCGAIRTSIEAGSTLREDRERNAHIARRMMPIANTKRPHAGH